MEAGASIVQFGAIWILWGQINLYRRVNELCSESGELMNGVLENEPPLHALLALLPPRLGTCILFFVDNLFFVVTQLFAIVSFCELLLYRIQVFFSSFAFFFFFLLDFRCCSRISELVSFLIFCSLNQS